MDRLPTAVLLSLPPSVHVALEMFPCPPHVSFWSATGHSPNFVDVYLQACRPDFAVLGTDWYIDTFPNPFSAFDSIARTAAQTGTPFLLVGRESKLKDEYAACFERAGVPFSYVCSHRPLSLFRSVDRTDQTDIAARDLWSAVIKSRDRFMTYHEKKSVVTAPPPVSFPPVRRTWLHALLPLFLFFY